ncbi:MAG: hypothetical protein HY000_06350 [Planctomycetes bacterium]|nr:hypothetical protein [Planctomycetota bacterium]
MSWYPRWKPYVPVARRRAQAASYAQKLAKKEGRELSPVKIEGRKISTSFWGQAWCDNLERYSDFANRLPRGRTYVRNGSVIDLRIEQGAIQAIVSGSQVYRVKIDIRTLGQKHWESIKQDCSQSITSLIDLLQGRFDQGIMQRLSQRDTGLFPQPSEIKMSCTCPDWAGLCKHVAATLYGVGARLDSAPELLFTLRNVDHLELIGQAVAAENLERTLAADQKDALGGDLGEIFGIEIDVPASEQAVASQEGPTRNATARPARRRTASARTGKSKAPAATSNAGRKQPARKKPAVAKISAKSTAGAPNKRKRIAR